MLSLLGSRPTWTECHLLAQLWSLFSRLAVDLGLARHLQLHMYQRASTILLDPKTRKGSLSLGLLGFTKSSGLTGFQGVLLPPSAEHGRYAISSAEITQLQ